MANRFDGNTLADMLSALRILDGVDDLADAAWLNDGGYPTAKEALSYELPGTYVAIGPSTTEVGCAVSIRGIIVRNTITDAWFSIEDVVTTSGDIDDIATEFICSWNTYRDRAIAMMAAAKGGSDEDDYM